MFIFSTTVSLKDVLCTVSFSGFSIVSDADLLNTSMPSPLPEPQPDEQDGGSDDEDRNELFAILQEASSDEQEDGDTQEDDDNEVNVDVEMEEDTASQLTGNKWSILGVISTGGDKW